MIPRLDEFTEFELQTLLVEVVAACELEAYESNCVRTTKYDILSLWRTQILNAISTVKMKEREISN